MTRSEWLKAEAVLLDALQRPTEEQRRAVDTIFFNDVIKRQLLDVLLRTGTALSAGQSSPLQRSKDSSSRRSVAIAAAPLLSPNDTVADGRFRIVRQIGRGGMGEVYLATDTKLETLVALKVLLGAAGREAQNARRCSGHPHIATLHDVLETPVGERLVTVLIMEHVNGRPADQVLNDGPVSIAGAVRWTREVASALAHAHDCDVLHCDLKPANVLITPDGVKVVDFGIGRSTFQPDGPGEPLRGTLPYMAPEQLESRQFSRSGDIYSLGVLLFELVTGERPFRGSGAELILRIVGAPPPRLSDFRGDVPPELEEIVGRALAKNPADRFRSARAFEQALADFAAKHEERRERGDVPDGPRQRISYWAAGASAAAIFVTFTGFVASAIFNGPLRRTGGFADESVLDWLVWGIRSLVAAAIITVMVAAVLAALKSVYTLLTRRLRGHSGLWFVAGAGERMPKIVPSPIGRVKLLLATQATIFVAFAMYFRDIFAGLDSFVSQESSAGLAALSPHNVRRQIAFDILLCLQLWVFGVAWLRMLKRGGTAWVDAQARSVAAAGLALTAVALFVGQVMPFRIIYHNHSERVLYKSQLCYMVGQREAEALLFCPLQPPPWSRVVTLGDPDFRRDGAVENIFSRIQSDFHGGAR